jgi:glycopeptide antibiotics resistance protein
MYHMNRNKNSKMNMPTESEQPQPAMSKAAGYIRAVMTALFILYLLLLVYLTLLSDHYNRRSFFRSINFVPFRTITNYLGAKINNDIIVTNLLGNIAAFVPMGFLVPFISKRVNKFYRVFLIAAGASMVIEVLQYVLAAGAADVDDLILNSAGGLLGYLIYKAACLVIKILSGNDNAS